MVITIKLISIEISKYGERPDKKFKIFSPRTCSTKNPFGYRVPHHGYLLTSCPGRMFCKIFLYLVFEVLVNWVT